MTSFLKNLSKIVQLNAVKTSEIVKKFLFFFIIFADTSIA